MPNFINKFQNGTERFVPQVIDTVDNWLFGERPILLERYLDNRICVHCQFRLRLSEFDTEDLCAVFSGPGRPFRFREPDNLKCTIALATKLNAINPSICHDDIEQPMFIGHIHTVQDPEGMPLNTFGVVVGLHRLDKGCGGIGDTLYFSPLTGFFKFGRLLTDREFMFMVGRPFVCDHQLGDHMIQGGPAVMDDFTSDDGKAKRRIGTDYTKEVLSRIVIRFSNDFISIAIQKSGNLDIEILDVLIGPSNLFPNPIQGVTHGGNSENVQGGRDSDPKARRLLQESEESRHAVSDPPQEEVAVQIAPSHPRGGYTATHTHLGTPEDAF